MKIVVNRCFGGFGLSSAAMHRYAELKGLTLYPERDSLLTTYWTCPPDQRPKILSGDDWYRASVEERRASNEAYNKAHLYDRDLDRTDPTLVQVVEELGKAADGDFAKLRVVEIPDDVDWGIDEYDGNESIHEKHRSWT